MSVEWINNCQVDLFALGLVKVLNHRTVFCSDCIWVRLWLDFCVWSSVSLCCTTHLVPSTGFCFRRLQSKSWRHILSTVNDHQGWKGKQMPSSPPSNSSLQFRNVNEGQPEFSSVWSCVFSFFLGEACVSQTHSRPSLSLALSPVMRKPSKFCHVHVILPFWSLQEHHFIYWKFEKIINSFP